MHLSRINISCKRAIHRQIYAGSQSVREVRNQQLSHSLMTGLQMDEHIARIALNQGATPQVKTYLTDALGSVIATAKADQSLEVGYAFSPYGQTQKVGVENQLAGSENSSQYTGREDDNNGLYFYRARYYDPILKRFISEDPIGLAGGINSHAYVEGDPVGFTDPDGYVKRRGNGNAGGNSADRRRNDRSDLGNNGPITKPQIPTPWGPGSQLYNPYAFTPFTPIPDLGFVCEEWTCEKNPGQCSPNDKKDPYDFMPKQNKFSEPPDGCTCSRMSSKLRDDGYNAPSANWDDIAEATLKFIKRMRNRR